MVLIVCWFALLGVFCCKNNLDLVTARSMCYNEIICQGNLVHKTGRCYDMKGSSSRRHNRCGVGPFNKFLFPGNKWPARPYHLALWWVICAQKKTRHVAECRTAMFQDVKLADKCGPSQVMRSKQGLIKILQGVQPSNRLSYAGSYHSP